MMNYDGKEYEKEYLYLYISESLCHAPDTNSVVNKLYLSEKNSLSPLSPLLQPRATTILLSVSVHLTSLGTSQKQNLVVFVLL